MLTDENLILERPHPAGLGGVQRIYRFANGYGLSAVNSPILHVAPFAWEFAVLEHVSEDGQSFELTYKTPLTEDVEVCGSDAEANDFIKAAAAILPTLPAAA